MESSFLGWLESTGYSEWILFRWGWQFMLSVHAVGLATIVGVVFALNLRLLGFYGTIPYTSLRTLMHAAWIGIGLNVFSGVSIFMSQATSYVENVPFLVKMGLIALGCVNLAYTQRTLRLEAAGWQAAGAAPPIALGLAGTSLLFWIAAVLAGRLIAYI